MSWVLSHPLTTLCYFLLLLTVVLLWSNKSIKLPLWLVALVLAIVFGLITNIITLIALLPIVVLAISVYYSHQATQSLLIRFLAGIVVIVLSVALSLHIVPGFNNLLVLDQVQISTNAIPFTLYLNFDTALIGILILGLSHPLIKRWSEWYSIFKQLTIKLPIVVIPIAGIALASGFVHFDPKLPHSLLIWLLSNLLITCVAEEALYRGFIQRHLAVGLANICWGGILAVGITAVLFGIRHFEGGIYYVLFATIAGIGYGWVYASTRRIEASILTHFGFNLLHFVFFTYPQVIST